jgi:tRNA pseudouridine13 synthase
MNDYLTRLLPGTGGTIKQFPEDFLVDELPLYSCSGSGEHLYLHVEKTGLTTHDLARQVARACHIRERDIGYAGLKDANATTRQYLSLPNIAPDLIAQMSIPGVKILSTSYHGNKLRLGHLAGNRFSIRIRDVADGAEEKARDILHVLETLGVPNLFGEQRYGALGNSHLIGKALLLQEYQMAAELIIGDPDQISNQRWREAARSYQAGELAAALKIFPGRFRDERRLIQQLLDGKSHRQAVFDLPRNKLRLYLSALQSSLFDRLVTMRLDSLERLWPGDLAMKHDNGACFSVVDPASEQPRADRLEISPTAPLYGYKVKLASGQTGIIEESLLDKEKLALADFKLAAGLSMTGERRPIRVPIEQISVATEQQDLVVGFVLPRGSFATSVLREIIKAEPEQPTN